MQVIMNNYNGNLDDVNMLTEDQLLNPSVANSKLSKKNLKIEKIEEKDGEKIVYVKESKSNILCG